MNPNRPYRSSSTPSSIPPMDDEARKELLATIAASRDLGPEMDHTLADRYLERLTQRQARYAQWQTRSRRLTSANLRRLWPLALVPLLVLGGLALVAITLALALHGAPPPAWEHQGHGWDSSQTGRWQDGPGGDPDGGGFFPLFGLFFWGIPLLALVVFLRRRAAWRRARYSGYSRVGPSSRTSQRPYRSQPLPAAQSDGPYGQYAPYERYEPYQPFDYAATSIPAPSRPTRVFVEEVAQPTRPEPINTLSDADNDADNADNAESFDDESDDESDDEFGDEPIERDEQAVKPTNTTTTGRPPIPPTRPLSNPAG